MLCVIFFFFSLLSSTLSTRIKITNVHKNEIYEFLVEKILDEDTEEGSSNLILSSEKKDEITEGELPTPRTRIS